jgi:hypothetical protein
MDKDLLKITTIKKKFVDQMPLLGYGDFCRLTKEGDLDHVGRVLDALVVVKVANNFKKVTARDWVEWRTNTLYFEAPDTTVAAERRKAATDAQKAAREEWDSLPQLFAD